MSSVPPIQSHNDNDDDYADDLEIAIAIDEAVGDD
jgi:hypothetical protein